MNFFSFVATLTSLFFLMDYAFNDTVQAKTPPPPPNYSLTCQDVLDQNSDVQYTRCENIEVICYESQARSGAVCQFKRKD